MNKSEKIKILEEQSFIPIMVKDDYDSKMLVEAIVEAGGKVIEYTCRRPGAREMIPWIRKNFPDMLIMGASLVDSNRAEKELSVRYDNFIPVDEMVDLGVDGLISIMRFSSDTYKKYAKDLIMIPGVETHNEALEQYELGADFIKFLGTNPWDVNFIKYFHAASHGLFKYLVTGGITPERMQEYKDAGATLFAAGFDLTLKGLSPESLTHTDIIERLKKYYEICV
jgi:2-dehydro-3-deoxyphosphogalactonate aldolase